MASLNFSVKVLNKTGFLVDKDKITDILLNIFKKEKNNNFVSGDIVVVFVSKSEIKRLNKKYRGKDSVTDVLSFFYNEKDVLGEIMVCPEYILKERNKEKEKSIYRVIIHGALHILGYTHENDKEEHIMEEKTRKYLK